VSLETESQEELLAQHGWRLSLASYASRASHWRAKWKPFPYLVYLAEIVEDAVRKGGARIVINAPPRHGKSELISHWLPVWYLDWFPENRVILSAYGDSLASDWGRQVRDELLMNESAWTTVRQDTQAVNDWRTTRGGGMRTAGVGGPIVGKGANLILIDDPHKNWEDAMSAVSRQRLIDWFNSTLYTRLEPDASIIVVHTRWHERDLTGYLLNEHAENWLHVRLPAIAEDGDPIGRERGAPLNPERFDLATLEKIRAAIGSQMFAGLYQQRPSPLEGGIVKRDWIRYWERLPENLTDFVLSFDLTFKKIGTSWVVGQAWARCGADRFLLDQVRARLSFVEQVAAVRALAAKFPKSTILIEEAANGAAVIDTLRKEIPEVIPIRATSSKEARLAACSPLFEAGNVYVPQRSAAPWVDGYVEEVVSFPNADADDQVDATTQALLRYKPKAVEVGPLNLEALDVGERTSPWRL
jgi:predicted phage terminase large subunit-like protein